jgi:hypothetical protein
LPLDHRYCAFFLNVSASHAFAAWSSSARPLVRAYSPNLARAFF